MISTSINDRYSVSVDILYVTLKLHFVVVSLPWRERRFCECVCVRNRASRCSAVVDGGVSELQVQVWAEPEGSTVRGGSGELRKQVMKEKCE